MQRIALLLTVAALGLAAAGSASGAKPSDGCPAAFSLGALSFTEFLQLERTVSGIAAGAFTEGELRSLFEVIDLNGNDALCVQLSHGFLVRNPAAGAYFYNVVDDRIPS